MTADHAIYAGHDPRTGRVTVALYGAQELGPARVITLSPAEARTLAGSLAKHAELCEQTNEQTKEGESK